MAECSDVNDMSDVQERRMHFLIESLAAFRVVGRADVIMICRGKEFYAHRWVLEASSSYFTTMFQSNLEEAKSGKVVFKDMEPETLDAILDFLYLGDVKKMKTDDQLMKVMAASHMMELQDLFQYCCSSLQKMLSPRNFLPIWTLAKKYEAEKMLVEVENYFLGNSIQILTSNDFLTSAADQLKDLVVLFKSKFKIMDRMLEGVVLWVLHDLPEREPFTGELFTFIDANRVSKQFAKSLLDGSELTTNSTKLADRLKDLVIEVCFAEEKDFEDGGKDTETSQSETTHVKTSGCKLFYFNQQKTTFHVATNFQNFASYIQVFDLDSMTWKPVKQLPYITFKVDAMCQHNECIVLIGSTAGNRYLLYDIRKNTLQYVQTGNNLCTPNATACPFKGMLWLVGGTAQNRAKTCVRINLDNRIYWQWNGLSPLNSSRNKPVLFTSENNLFVVGGISSLTEQFIEYTTGSLSIDSKTGISQIDWTVADSPRDLISADAHFFLFNNQLCGARNFNGVMAKFTYNKGHWDLQEFPDKFHKELKINSITHFPSQKTPSVLISTINGNLGIPTYVLNLESLVWTKLPEPKGICEVKGGENLQKTICY